MRQDAPQPDRREVRHQDENKGNKEMIRNKLNERKRKVEDC
jgi:hypothetical protein